MADSSVPRFSLARLRRRRGSAASVDTDDAHAPLVATVAFVIAAYCSVGSSDFCTEGAWTHLAFARSLRLGDGFVWQRGADASVAYPVASPLWDLLLALAPWRVQPVVATKMCGALCHAALAWGALRLARALVIPARALAVGVVAGLCVACDPLLVFAAGSGMAVPLSAALSVWTLENVASARSDHAGKLAPASALLLGAACTLAAPWCVLVSVAYGLLTFAALRIRRASWVALGAALALALAHNVPAFADDRELGVGLAFFARCVLPDQALFVSGTGAVLVACALWRGAPARALALAWLCSVFIVAACAVSAGAEFRPSFEVARHFAVLAALPSILAATQLPSRPGVRALLLAPIALASVLMLPKARALQRAQEARIESSQTQPTRTLARWLPAGARLIVVGNSAARFFLPRSVHISASAGLDSAAFGPAPAEAWLCALLHERPTHVFAPEHTVAWLERSLVLTHAQRFGSGVVSVAAQIDAIRPETRQRCGFVQ